MAATLKPNVDPVEQDRLKVKASREAVVVRFIKDNRSFSEAPSRITATHVFGDNFRINVYVEEYSGEVSVIKHFRMIHSELLRYPEIA